MVKGEDEEEVVVVRSKDGDECRWRLYTAALV